MFERRFPRWQTTPARLADEPLFLDATLLQAEPPTDNSATRLGGATLILTRSERDALLGVVARAGDCWLMTKLIDFSGVSGAPTANIHLTSGEAQTLLSAIANQPDRGDDIPLSLRQKIAEAAREIAAG